ncbi:glycerophosphodiester phosphodiesterase [Streptomyces sp. NBC_00083]|uniref:glycerophosphodiester phosphodiesterase n=1 Tax=Streptomyces sp. NBC_00083 TaxID=2975647 RepID=UPI00224EB09C|nr:glycerophosphodiester phosphodiesterase [Streptomyces sp. NBC_00083]MCX5385993.1 glycerophosphodiester phosphodiesterase [Streptomyces sp. NBC_00083]
MRTVTAVAHRGDPYRVRENTLPSIASALERGADAVEIDVRTTKDGVPVLLHDDTLKRLWGVDRPVASLPYEEVREVTGGGVPTLRRALMAVGTHRVLIDLPGATEESVRKVVGTVRECGAGERVYYCAGPVAMLRVRAADPGAEIALTWTKPAPPRPALVAAVKPRWLNYRFGLVDPDVVDRVHRDGMLLAAWTADTRRAQRRLVEYGVDAITTNRLDALRAVLSAASGG